MGQIMQVSEETLLADIERRLVDEFPYVSSLVVDTLIHKEHARFEASRIRDFVPVVPTATTRPRVACARLANRAVVRGTSNSSATGGSPASAEETPECSEVPCLRVQR
jgi:hypothetical protein